MDRISLQKDLEEAYAEASRKLHRNSPTVVILGSTGAGKSSIINGIFGKNLAKVSDGEPCTQSFDYYPSTEKIPINIYDSKGLEQLDSNFMRNLQTFTRQRTADSRGDILKGIHCVWYVVNGGSARWTEGETQIVRKLSEIPTLIIINKCDKMTKEQQETLISTIESKQIPSVRGILLTSANPGRPTCPKHGDDELTTSSKNKTWLCNECGLTGSTINPPPLGFDKLVEKTADLIPVLAREAFLSVQKANLHQKRIAAYGTVVAASLSAYAIGWSPIPFSDAPLLIGIQLGMTATIAKIFDVIQCSILPVIAGQLSVLGIGLGVTNLLKLIPGIGTVIGGLIDSTVAGISTAIIGCIYTSVFSIVYAKVGDATPEKKNSALLKLLSALEIKNIMFAIRPFFAGISFKSKEGAQNIMADIGSQVEDHLQQKYKPILDEFDEL